MALRKERTKLTGRSKVLARVLVVDRQCQPSLARSLNPLRGCVPGTGRKEGKGQQRRCHSRSDHSTISSVPGWNPAHASQNAT